MGVTVNGGDVGGSADRDTDVLFTGTCQKFLFAFLSNTVYLTYAVPTSSPNPLLLDAYNASGVCTCFYFNALRGQASFQ